MALSAAQRRAERGAPRIFETADWAKSVATKRDLAAFLQRTAPIAVRLAPPPNRRGARATRRDRGREPSLPPPREVSASSISRSLSHCLLFRSRPPPAQVLRSLGIKRAPPLGKSRVKRFKLVELRAAAARAFAAEEVSSPPRAVARRSAAEDDFPTLAAGVAAAARGGSRAHGAPLAVGVAHKHTLPDLRRGGGGGGAILSQPGHNAPLPSPTVRSGAATDARMQAMVEGFGSRGPLTPRLLEEVRDVLTPETVARASRHPVVPLEEALDEALEEALEDGYSSGGIAAALADADAALAAISPRRAGNDPSGADEEDAEDTNEDTREREEGAALAVARPDDAGSGQTRMLFATEAARRAYVRRDTAHGFPTLAHGVAQARGEWSAAAAVLKEAHTHTHGRASWGALEEEDMAATFATEILHSPIAAASPLRVRAVGEEEEEEEANAAAAAAAAAALGVGGAAELATPLTPVRHRGAPPPGAAALTGERGSAQQRSRTPPPEGARAARRVSPPPGGRPKTKRITPPLGPRLTSKQIPPPAGARPGRRPANHFSPPARSRPAAAAPPPPRGEAMPQKKAAPEAARKDSARRDGVQSPGAQRGGKGEAEAVDNITGRCLECAVM